MVTFVKLWGNEKTTHPRLVGWVDALQIELVFDEVEKWMLVRISFTKFSSGDFAGGQFAGGNFFLILVDDGSCIGKVLDGAQ